MHFVDTNFFLLHIRFAVLSMAGLGYWMESISQYAGDSIEKTLVGNKCDLIDTKAVKTEQGAGLAKDVGVTFFEASAKSGVGVDKIFLETAMNIVRRQANGEVVQPDLANAPAEEEAGGKKGKGKKGKGSSRRKSNCMQQ